MGKMIQSLWKTVGQFLKKVEVQYDSAIPPLGIYTKELKSETLTDVHQCS